MIVGGRLGVDQHAVYLGTFYLQAVFKRGDDIVDPAHLHAVRQSAVAGDLDLVAHASDGDFVDVDDFGQGGGSVAQVLLDGAVAGDGDGALDGGGLAFDVREHGFDLRQLFANFFFDAFDEAVSFEQRHFFVDFNVLFHMQLAIDGLDADVVQDYVFAGGDGTNLVEDTFGYGGARDGVDDDIGVGEDAANSFGGFLDQLFGVLKGGLARE